MPSTALDSDIFRDIFTTAEMRNVFSDEFRTACYLEIEAALARVQGRMGIIPQHAADEIMSKCRVGNIDFRKLKTQTERIGYPILGVVQQIVALCDKGLGEWCHWGATTQDITDTAAIMQVRAALDLVDAEIEKIAAALAGLAKRFRDTPMAGRSNLQQAVPITFGFKCASLLAAFQRHRQRLKELRPRVLVGEFAGAAGTLSSLGADGLKVQEALMAELRLGQPEIAWHTIRDRFGEVGCFLGLVTGTLGKIAMDVKLLMQTEVAEVFEPFHEGRGSSSTMPQKRNPIACLYIHSTAALVRHNAAALLEAAVADHERSTGPWEIEWIALPEIFLLSSGALAQTRIMLEGLQVDEKRMRDNLDMTSGMIVSEAVMMGLGPYLGRQRAHDLVYDICREVVAKGVPLVDLLAQNAEITTHLKRPELEKLCDPANYLGLAGEMVDRVLAAEFQNGCVAALAVTSSIRTTNLRGNAVAQSLAELKYEIAVANRICANEGVVDAFGHVSARHPGNPSRYFLSRSRAPELIEPSDIYEFDLNSVAIGNPSAMMYSERVIHGEIYKARPDVMAVCHHHSPAILSYCITGEKLLPVYHLGAVIGHDVPFWDQRDEFGDTNLLVRFPEEGASLARALGKHPLVLMNRHGATVVGDSLRQLVFRTIYSCRNAEYQTQAKAIGKLDQLSPGEIDMAGKIQSQPNAISRAYEQWIMRLTKAGGAPSRGKSSSATASAARKKSNTMAKKKPARRKRR